MDVQWSTLQRIRYTCLRWFVCSWRGHDWMHLWSHSPDTTHKWMQCQRCLKSTST